MTSSFSYASEDSDVQDLFNRYERIVSGHETHLVEEVFSANFLKENGGKKEFIKKVKSEPRLAEKSFPATSVTWKKAVKGESIFAKLKPKSVNNQKSKKPESHSEFIVVKENGKLKIDGTISDAD
jgi:hypothetical protein